MRMMRIEYFCDNCAAQISGGEPVYMVQESRVVIDKIIPTTIKPAMVCEKCFEAMMEHTHEAPDPAPAKPTTPDRALDDEMIRKAWTMMANHAPLFQISRELGISTDRAKVLLETLPKEYADKWAQKEDLK